jgi:hypothetical protein
MTLQIRSYHGEGFSEMLPEANRGLLQAERGSEKCLHRLGSFGRGNGVVADGSPAANTGVAPTKWLVRSGVDYFSARSLLPWTTIGRNRIGEKKGRRVQWVIEHVAGSSVFGELDILAGTP